MLHFLKIMASRVYLITRIVAKDVLDPRMPLRIKQLGKICRDKIVLIGIVGGVLLSGCSSLLPSSKETTRSPWPSFESVKAAYDQVIPNQTTVRQLKQIGFDLYSTPNIRILNYMDIAATTQSIKWEYLESGLQRCFMAKTGCQAYELEPKNISNKHYGNFWLDILNFNRKSNMSGWSFKALFIVVDELIIYKLWSGIPLIDADRQTVNPLGPLQEPSGLILRGVP